MSAHATQAERSTAFLRSPWTAPLLVFIAACFALVVVGVLTKQIKQDDPGPYRTAAVETIGFTMNGHEAAPAPASPLGPAFAPTLRALLKELLKQAIDQPGHFLIAAIPIWLSRRLTGVPWYGWPVVPLLAYREWLQWPSNRWWDPPLDWACLALGVIVATWALGALRRRPLHASRQSSRGGSARNCRPGTPTLESQVTFSAPSSDSTWLQVHECRPVVTPLTHRPEQCP